VVRPRLQRIAPIAIAIVLLAGCSPAAPAGGSGRLVGHGPAIVTVTGFDVGCCYIEGSLHFGRLQGPTPGEWGMDQPLPMASASDLNAPREVGSKTFDLDPGDYTATFWQRPCDGNCGNLDPVASQCSVTFGAQAGVSVRIDVTFALQKPCTAQVS
jgi:hypothetical protein